MKAIWKGVLSFGLVNIPVSLHAAERQGSARFDLLHSKDLSKIRYARICKKEDIEVSYAELVRGSKAPNGQYVILRNEDLARVNPRLTKAIRLQNFVSVDAIDSILIERPFYVESQTKDGTAYRLVLEALRRSKTVGIGSFVLRQRQYLGMLVPRDDILMLVQLRYETEIRQPEDILVPAETALEEEHVEAALAVIRDMQHPLALDEFADEYAEHVKEIIRQKARKARLRTKAKAPEATKASEVLQKLRLSVERSKEPETSLH